MQIKPNCKQSSKIVLGHANILGTFINPEKKKEND